MKSVVAIATCALVVAVASPAAGFSGSSSFSGSVVTGTSSSVRSNNGMTMEYIPSGVSKAQWEKMKQAEAEKKKGKNFGKVGITTFQSRTFSEWQKSGGINLFPVDPKSVKDPSQLPYMQRPGGKPDNSDLKKGPKLSFGAKKVEKKEEEPPKKNWWTL